MAQGDTDELYCARHCQTACDGFFLSSVPRRDRASSPNTPYRMPVCTRRESISRGLACGASYRAIGRELGRSASTISREVGRNGGPGKYRAYEAEKQFLKRARRPKPYLLASAAQLRNVVIRLLEADWSPEQISGWLKRRSPDGKTMCVSHETIYRSLFVQARGVLREELKKHLRTQRMFRHARLHHAAVSGGIPESISIHARPAEIAERALPGHWEGVSFREQIKVLSSRSSTEARDSPCFARSTISGPKPSPKLLSSRYASFPPN